MKTRNVLLIAFIGLAVMSASFGVRIARTTEKLKQVNQSAKEKNKWCVQCDTEFEFELVSDYLEKFRQNYEYGPRHKRKLVSP